MKSGNKEILRVIDANLNRLGEGLRVLEEIARLVLNDVDLTAKLKNLRHELVIRSPDFNRQLIQSRNSGGDVGAGLEAASKLRGDDLVSITTANAHRTQEALRVLEEFAIIPGVQLNSKLFSRARFEMYGIEQVILGKLSRLEKVRRLRGLYVILDMELLRGKDHLDIARAIINNGAGIIQLRDKVGDRQTVYEEARQLKELCENSGALFIVNDYLDIALAVNAGGLHIGQRDLPVSVARRLLPLTAVLGCSVTTDKMAIDAVRDGADYLGVGSIFPTSTKEDVTVIGLDSLRDIRNYAGVPVAAIGGINRGNIKEVSAAGAEMAAVISAILLSEDPGAATAELNKLMEGGNDG